jgi:CRISPR-associated endonuclease Cas2
MLLSVIPAGPLPRHIVFAYDIASARRARRVRRTLEPLRRAKQYSVFETVLHAGEFRGVLAELIELCRLPEDKLAVWWPRGSIRLEWQAGGMRPILCAPAPGRPSSSPRACESCGNFVVCYDVRDPARLEKAAACIAAEGAMVQRSIYWLRAPYLRLEAIMRRCGSHLTNDDLLWAYPLCGADQLWRVGPEQSAILPVTADRWVKAR